MIEFIELNKSYSKNLKVLPYNQEPFQEEFKKYISQVLENQEKQEEYIKKLISDFLQKIFINNKINISGNIDLAITDKNDKVQVMFEVKSLLNKKEMVTKESFNRKALHELVHYYMNERIVEKNASLKKCIITNGLEWFCIDSLEMDRVFFRNNKVYKFYSDYVKRRLSGNTTEYLYSELEVMIDEIIENHKLKVVHIDMKNLFNKTSPSEINQSKLKDLYYFFSHENLLKEDIFTDSNSLNKEFYNELLYLMGLEEEKGKNSGSLIRRLSEKKREAGSLMENTIARLKAKVSMSEELYFDVAIQLSVLWINRMLFLKLLESQLVEFNHDQSYKFLNTEKISSFEDLYDLFFSVLAKKQNERPSELGEEINKIPYLNSSLFEESIIEKKYGVGIDTLRDLEINYYKKTCILDYEGKRKKGKIGFLEYLLSFLDSYNFSSSVIEKKKSQNDLINASVLGLIFEKINGYKDGSFFTPGKITMYMTRKSIRSHLVHKINSEFSLEITNLNEVNGYISSIEEAEKLEKIVDELTICDPAVGSGHFLVSALNEIVAIKFELRLLKDENGFPISNFKVEVINDELVITDLYNQPFKYSRFDQETSRVQKVIFEEKKKIIENTLFGVDINPNSVNICRLRLWIELLKNAYYNGNNQLVTLPNIDINIKQGNSLISRYEFDSPVSAFTKNSMKVSDYLEAVHRYINTDDKLEKNKFREKINKFKKNYRTDIDSFDPIKKDLRKLQREYYSLTDTIELFELSELEVSKRNQRIDELKQQIDKFEEKIKNIENNKIFENAFEWRFEFPNALDTNGNFIGFDIIIGNPPYVYRNANIEIYKQYFKDHYFNDEGNFDLYKYFIELAIKITKIDGINCLITNSSFLLQSTFEKTRKYLLDNAVFEEFYPLGPKAFAEATVDTVIYSLRKSKCSDYIVRVNIPENLGFGKDAYFISTSRFIKNEYSRFDIFLNDEEHKLINDIRRKCRNIEDLFDVSLGINTGYIKSELTSEVKESEKYHPMITGKGISYYGDVNTEGFIMYDQEYVKSRGKKGRTLPNEKYFNQEKILIVRTRNLSLKQRIIATIDKNNGYNLNRLSNIIPRDNQNKEDLFGLLGWINSSFYNWIFTKEIVDYEIKPIYLKKCPIKNVADSYLVNLVKDV
ncbi:type IIG restriction enzyme/methyltransferase [Enterococcus sp. DIV1314a]|uniref:type IIG restriction enzyme/methyltransferase n=1 Tax=Enterococcus sp. DIV1314a TaxID=2774660 RepID=UPI003F1EFAD5